MSKVDDNGTTNPQAVEGQPRPEKSSVQSEADRLEELSHWVAREYDMAKRQSEVARQLRNYQQALRHDSYARAMSKVYARASEIIQESQQAQVEHEAKRAAAD